MVTVLNDKQTISFFNKLAFETCIMTRETICGCHQQITEQNKRTSLITTAGANRGVSHFEAFFLGGVGEVFACGTGRGSWC